MKLVRISTVPISLNILLKGQLRFLNQFYEVTAISGAGMDLDEVREREGVKTHVVEIERQISLIKDLISLWKLYLFFKKEKPEMIHSITPKAGLLSMIAGNFARVPVRMHTFTGLVFPYKKGLFQKILILTDKILCAAATHIYPEGEGVKNDLQKFKITSKPLKVIGNGNVNGINTSYFSAENFTEKDKELLKSQLGIAAEDFVFIFVGRLVGDKGINELVEAFCQLTSLPSEGSGVSVTKTPKLLLVGSLETELDPLLPETLKRISQHPGIISVGFQKDVRPYFAISDCLAFPSYREGFPNVVMQAGAMDLPALVSDINGCNEIIIEGENGRIIPVKNAAALHKAMEKMLRDEEGFLKMNENARRMITSRYEQSVVWSALLEEYQKIIS